jgi:hypothetical protein
MAKAAKSSPLGIKYADKSAGQPDLVPIFNKLSRMLRSYARGDLKIRGGEEGQIALVNEKPVVIEGRKKDELWVASALIQKGYVGFYYMPVYMNDTVRSRLGTDLLKCLKGKACFHIKKDDPVLFAQIEKALHLGVDAFKMKGWI